MKTFFIRTWRAVRPCASRIDTSAAHAAALQDKSDADADALLARIHALDTATCWPTHRIRNFVTTTHHRRALR